MKKIIFIALSCVLLFTGCGEKEESNTESEDSIATQTADDSDTASDDNAAAQTADDSDTASVKTASGDDMVEITENLFISQTNDIYINTEDYLGKTLKYEGIFTSFDWDETGTTYYYVIRYGPGCCGYDSNAGFEVIWDGDYPEEDDWVEAVGVLETYEENGTEYLRLKLSSLTVLDERGDEYVAN